MARPREFDRDEALRAALKVFWSKGFDGASFKELETEMGLGRSSLVAAFKDKQSLFDEALELYAKEFSEPKNRILRGSKRAREGFRDFFTSITSSALSGKTPGGCFFVNSAAAGDGSDPRVREFVESRIKVREKDMLDLLARAQESGELSKGLNIRAVGHVLQALALGIPILARVRRSKSYFDEMVAEALGLLG